MSRLAAVLGLALLVVLVAFALWPSEPRRAGAAALSQAPRVMPKARRKPPRSKLAHTPPRKTRRKRPRRRKHDPLIAAIPENPGVHGILDLSSILKSELFEMALACNPEMRDMIQRADALGLKLEDLDRAMISEDLVAVQGDFSKVRFDMLPIPVNVEERGDATLYHFSGGPGFAVWKDEVVLMGPNQEAIEAGLSRIGGPGRPQPRVGDIAAQTPASEMLDIFPIGWRQKNALEEVIRSLPVDAHWSIDLEHGLDVRAELAGDPYDVEVFEETLREAVEITQDRAEQGDVDPEAAALFDTLKITDGVLTGAVPTETIAEIMGQCALDVL